LLVLSERKSAAASPTKRIEPGPVFLLELIERGYKRGLCIGALRGDHFLADYLSFAGVNPVIFFKLPGKF